MPRSDVIILETQPTTASRRWRPLPLSPYPVYTGTAVLTHLFGSPDPPAVRHSMARTKVVQCREDATEIEAPIMWLNGHAWRRWGSGVMLGYRSYTGLELEVITNRALSREYVLTTGPGWYINGFASHLNLHSTNLWLIWWSTRERRYWMRHWND